MTGEKGIGTTSGSGAIWRAALFRSSSTTCPSPSLSARDKTFAAGWIGVGSFDDTGKVSRIRIWSPEFVSKNVDFYSGPGD